MSSGRLPGECWNRSFAAFILLADADADADSGGGDLGALLGLQLHRITLRLQRHLAFGRKPLGAGILRKQADVLRRAGQQQLAAGDADVFAGAEGQAVQSVLHGQSVMLLPPPPTSLLCSRPLARWSAKPACARRRPGP